MNCYVVLFTAAWLEDDASQSMMTFADNRIEAMEKVRDIYKRQGIDIRPRGAYLDQGPVNRVAARTGRPGRARKRRMKL